MTPVQLHSDCPTSCPVRGKEMIGPLTHRESCLAAGLEAVVSQTSFTDVVKHIEGLLCASRRDGVCEKRMRMVFNMGFPVHGGSYIGGVLFRLLSSASGRTGGLLRFIERDGLCPHACTVVRVRDTERGFTPVSSFFFIGNLPRIQDTVLTAQALVATGVVPMKNKHIPWLQGGFGCTRAALPPLPVLWRRWRAWHVRRAKRWWCSLV
jgi:hypothetical protein